MPSTANSVRADGRHAHGGSRARGSEARPVSRERAAYGAGIAAARRSLQQTLSTAAAAKRVIRQSSSGLWQSVDIIPASRHSRHGSDSAGALWTSFVADSVGPAAASAFPSLTEAAQETMTTVDDVPEDALCVVLSFLNARDLLVARLCCRYFRQAIDAVSARCFGEHFNVTGASLGLNTKQLILLSEKIRQPTAHHRKELFLWACSCGLEAYVARRLAVMPKFECACVVGWELDESWADRAMTARFRRDRWRALLREAGRCVYFSRGGGEDDHDDAAAAEEEDGIDVADEEEDGSNTTSERVERLHPWREVSVDYISPLSYLLYRGNSSLLLSERLPHDRFSAQFDDSGRGRFGPDEAEMMVVDALRANRYLDATVSESQLSREEISPDATFAHMTLNCSRAVLQRAEDNQHRRSLREAMSGRFRPVVGQLTQKSQQWTSALFVAVKGGRRKIVELLVQAAKLHIAVVCATAPTAAMQLFVGYASTFRERSPLFAASRQCFPELCEILLAQNADPLGRVRPDAMSPLEVVVMTPSLSSQIEAGTAEEKSVTTKLAKTTSHGGASAEAVATLSLLCKHLSPATRTGAIARRVLMHCCGTGDLPSVHALVMAGVGLTYDEDLEQVRPDIEMFNLQNLERLAGGEMNEVNANERLNLFQMNEQMAANAARNGENEAFLRQQHAVENHWANRAAVGAQQGPRGHGAGLPLVNVAPANLPPGALVQGAGAGPKNTGDVAKTPLLAALMNGHDNVAEFLLRHAKTATAREVNVPLSSGKTALYLVCERGAARMARLLLEAGGSLDVQTCSGKSPLHACVEHSHENVLKIVCERHVDVRHITLRTKGEQGVSPFMLAEKRGKNGLILPMLRAYHQQVRKRYLLRAAGDQVDDVTHVYLTNKCVQFKHLLFSGERDDGGMLVLREDNNIGRGSRAAGANGGLIAAGTPASGSTSAGNLAGSGMVVGAGGGGGKTVEGGEQSSMNGGLRRDAVSALDGGGSAAAHKTNNQESSPGLRSSFDKSSESRRSSLERRRVPSSPRREQSAKDSKILSGNCRVSRTS